jgi:DNA-binding winged helix-turn-helix (wHTH) protein
MSEPRPADKIQVGHAVLDLSARELIVAGAPVRLEPRLFAVLAKLAASEGAQVSRDELLACWGDEAGSDEALTQSISVIRRLLGDTTRPYRVIQTLPKSGYRLVANRRAMVAHRVPESPSVAAPSVARAVLDRPWTTLGVTAGVAMIVLASIAAVDAITYRPRGVDVVVQVPVTPPEAQ